MLYIRTYHCGDAQNGSENIGFFKGGRLGYESGTEKIWQIFYQDLRWKG